MPVSLSRVLCFGLSTVCGLILIALRQLKDNDGAKDAHSFLRFCQPFACWFPRMPLFPYVDLPPTPSYSISVMSVTLMLHFHSSLVFSTSLQPSAQPKHCYVLDPSCTVSDMKETKAGGRTLFYFELGWPSMSPKEEGEDEGDGESCRCVCMLCDVCCWFVSAVVCSANFRLEYNCPRRG